MMAAVIGVRRVEPEWLDALPALDPRALRSRRDLSRVNALMGNAHRVARELARHLGPGPHALAELGAGDGAFALALANTRGLRGRSAELALVDRQPCAGPFYIAALRERGWHAAAVQADVFAWLAAPGAGRRDAIVANLFLHHFEAAALSRMLALVARRTRLFVACEPHRCAFALAGASLLGAVGCNDVTRHDAVVSVRAGFAGREIGALWPQDGRWHIEEGARGPFSHVFVARRP
jgi:hypothetical protein